MITYEIQNILKKVLFMVVEPNVYAYIINSIVMIFLFMFFLGGVIKVTQMLLAICAYPVYLSMYALEDFVGIKPNKKSFIRLNIPKKMQNKDNS